MRIWFDGMYREPEAVDASVREYAAQMNRIPMERNTFFIGDSQPLNPLSPPAIERLGEINVPTLLIAGELDHSEVLRATDLMTTQIPDAQQVIISTTAHVPNMEKPTEFNQIVLGFLGDLTK